MISSSDSFAKSAQFTKTDKKAPNFALFTSDNKERKILGRELSNLPFGGFLLLNFTSYTCKPCTKEIPELQNLVANHGKGRVKLWIIYTDSNREKVSSSARSIGITGTVLSDMLGSVSHKYGVKIIPTTFVINKSSKIRVIMSGYSDDNMKQLKEYIKSKEK